MGDTESPRAGIDLDTICINELMSNQDSSSTEPERTLRCDPDNYRVFVNDIFKKMKGRDTFLSFSRQITSVNQTLNMAYSSAGDIATVILKDLALTAQILKLVNSPFYRQFSNKGIATISEAMIILGTDEVRQLAAGLKVYEMMKDLANSEILKEKALKGLQRSIMAGLISMERKKKASDALQISAMVYDLGEYLVALFDPETYVRVEIVMEEERLSRDKAAKRILGLAYSDLGRVVASNLNLPEEVVNTMKPVTQLPGKGAAIPENQEARYLVAFINELCNIPVGEGLPDPYETAGALTDKYRHILGIDLRRAMNLLETSKEKVIRHAALLAIDPVVKKARDTGAGIKNKADLDHGVSQVEDALKGEMSIHEIFTRLVDTMDNCFYFNQVIISIKKKDTNTMMPRFIRGENRPESFTQTLDFKIDSTPDIFNNAITHRTDMIVRDAVKEAYKKQIPKWYMSRVVKPLQVKGFALFPVFVDNKILSMIYVDWDENAPALTENIVDYIRVFREHMIKTFTLHSR